jgi:uroporphyrinogen decarboxylase
MKLAGAVVALLAASSVTAFTPSSTKLHMSAPAVESATAQTSEGGPQLDPLLIRAARGEKVERTPVWMMRQAGRHIKEYRDLCKKYPTFRERSEIPEVAVEVSLQPWRNYQTDGCILFSDILTPFPGMGVEFTIDEKLGPITEPIRSWDDARKVKLSELYATGQIGYSLHTLILSIVSTSLDSCHGSRQVNAFCG